ncbi:hypothetical protein D3C75_643130 [compost metagenome]
MATAKFVKKEPAGPLGNFKYTYECTCNNKSKKTITVQAANDNEAKQLAELECNEQCGDS